jgi:hypothetical protein
MKEGEIAARDFLYKRAAPLLALANKILLDVLGKFELSDGHLGPE